MKRFILSIATALLCKSFAMAATPQAVFMPPVVSISSVNVSAGGSVTINISTPTSVGPYSAGQYNYISHVHIEMYAASTLTGGATPVTCTTINMQSLAFKLPTAAATGTTTVFDMSLDNPIQSAQGGNTILTCPATASVIWNIVLTYFQGQ